MLAGCGSAASSAAVSTCIKGDTQGGGDDAFFAKRVCPCVVSAFQKAGGSLQAVTDYFQLEENQISLHDRERDLREAKNLQRAVKGKAALTHACEGVEKRALLNDPND